MLKREWNGIDIPNSILSKFPFIPNELPKKSIDRILFFPFLEITNVLLKKTKKKKTKKKTKNKKKMMTNMFSKFQWTQFLFLFYITNIS